MEFTGNNLCTPTKIRTGVPITIGNTIFKNFGVYRVCFDPNGKSCIVNGESMGIRKFKNRFDLYIPVLKERMKEIGLLVNDNVISFAAFKKLVDIHTYTGYGYGNRIKKKIIFIGKPKDNMFAFYPIHTDNVNALKEAYDYYTRVVDGEWEVLDNCYVMWGNTGIPLSYGTVRAI